VNSLCSDFHNYEEEMNNQITVNNRVVDWEANMTVEMLLKQMNYTYKLIIVKVNDELVKREDYAIKVIPQNADVKVIHLIAGG